MITIRKLGKNTIEYALGTFIRYLAIFILIPIYTSALSVSEYGAFETLTVINQTLIILMGFGLSNALLRFYSECKSETEIHEMVRTTTILALLFSLILFALLTPFFDQISQNLLGDETQTLLIGMTFLWAIGIAFNEQVFAYYRARHEARKYVFISLCLFLCQVFLNILMVHVLELGLFGILSGNIISSWGINFWLFNHFWSRGWTISLRWSKVLLGFGLPLVVARFSWVLLNSADRYFLAYYRDLSEVGMYGLGYKTGLMVQIIVIVPFQLAWGPFVFSRVSTEKENAIKDFSKIFTYLIFTFSFVSLGLFLFASDIIYVLGAGKFDESVKVVPFVLVAYLFNGIYYWAGNLFHLEKKTTWLSGIVVSMAGINLFLNWLVVPIWGWWGAAIVTVLTIGGTGLLTLLVSYQFYPVSLQIKRLGKIVFVVLLILMVYFLFPIPAGILSWFVRGLFIAAFPIMLFIMGFFTPSEIRFVNSSLEYLKQGFGSIFVY